MRHHVVVSVMLAVALQSSDAVVQTSRGLVRSNLRANYFMVKDLFRQAYAGKRMPIFDNVIDLVDCGDEVSDSVGQAIAATNDPVTPLITAAHDVTRLRALFIAAGYPEQVWKPLLVEYEEQQLEIAIAEARSGPHSREGFETSPADEHSGAFYPRFARALNAYRRTSGADLPEVMIEGGCGAGEIGVYVKTSPPNASVVFIPRFFYQLCQKQGVDPTNVGRCDWWREAAEGMLQGFAGDYIYRARWPDGTTREGRISFTDPTEGQTFVIRKP